MKIELRNIKHHPSMSEETNAFEADVYVNDKPVGSVRNSGRGEGNYPNIPNKTLLDEIFKWIDSQPPVQGPFGPLEMTLDLYLGLLVQKDLQMRQAKRLFENHICFTNEAGELLRSKKLSKERIADVHAGREPSPAQAGERMLNSVQEVFEVLTKT